MLSGPGDGASRRPGTILSRFRSSLSSSSSRLPPSSSDEYCSSAGSKMTSPDLASEAGEGGDKARARAGGGGRAVRWPGSKAGGEALSILHEQNRRTRLEEGRAGGAAYLPSPFSSAARQLSILRRRSRSLRGGARKASGRGRMSDLVRPREGTAGKGAEDSAEMSTKTGETASSVAKTLSHDDDASFYVGEGEGFRWSRSACESELSQVPSCIGEVERCCSLEGVCESDRESGCEADMGLTDDKCDSDDDIAIYVLPPDC